MKTSRCGSTRILGSRLCCQSYRAARTRLARLSVAMRDFFICQPKPVPQIPRQLRRIGANIMDVTGPIGQLRHRHVRPGLDLAPKEARNRIEFATASRAASGCRSNRPSHLVPLHNPNRACRRYPQAASCFPTGQALSNKGDNPFADIQ